MFTNGLKRKSYDVIVIGAGIQGSCLAFELGKRGVKNVLLIEKEYVSSGATGRCAAGIRTQFGRKQNLEIAIGSMKIWEEVEKYTGYPHSCGVEKTGYMCLALNEAELRTFEKNVALQETYNTGSVMLTPDEVKKLAPGISYDNYPVLGASWNEEDGTADPHNCTTAFSKGAEKFGVEVATYTKVEHLVAENGQIKGVMTDRYGFIEAGCVYNMANSYAPVLAAEIGDILPIKNERHQIFVTEPVAPLGVGGRPHPMVLTFCRGTYSKQTAHGSFTIGIDETPPHSYNFQPTWQFAEECCKKHVDLFPFFRHMRVLRQWAGFYDVSPDENTIVHFSENAKGLVSVCGFSGHGFLLGPRMGILLANNYCGMPDDIDIEMFSMKRYETGQLLSEPMCV